MFLNQTVIPPFLQGQAAIFFGGNVNIGRRTNFNLHDKPFGDIGAMVEADLRIVNLACVVAAQGQQGIYKGEEAPRYCRARPEQINLLTEANIDVVLTANNHALDYDTAALFEQNDYLERAGILHCGTGSNVNDAARPLFIKVNDIVIALFNVDATTKFYAATENKPGIFYLPPDRPELWENFFTEKIADAKRKADVVLVAPHWGPKGGTSPVEPIKNLGRLLIDCGVDAVLGCHCHLLQGVETYNQRPIIYSPGNFLFDVAPKLGGTFLLTVSKKGVEQIFFSPLLIDHCKISPATTNQIAKLDAYFLEACQKFNTKCTVLPSGLIKMTFEPPTRVEEKLEAVELSTSKRNAEKIPPLTEPLPEWTVDSVPDDARIEPQKFGALKLAGCRIDRECLLMKKRQMLYVETYWTLDESTDKDLRIQILGVPTIKNAMPNFGDGMEHQACDWMWSTNRWKAGVIYRERFGLRPPIDKDLLNINVRVRVAVFDNETELGKYIHPTTITLQLPALDKAPQPSTLEKISKPSTPAKTSKPSESVDIKAFKLEFALRNNAVFFMLNNFKSDATNFADSICRRAKLFEEHLKVKVTLVTNDWQNDLSEQKRNYGMKSPILNMYEDFQEINREVEEPREIYIQPMHEGWKLELSDNELRIYQQDGSLVMNGAYFPDSSKLSCINFRNENQKIFRRDFYDRLGFLSCRQELNDETQQLTEATYYRPDGTVAVQELYEMQNAENLLTQMKLLDREGNVTKTFTTREDAISHWLSSVFNDKEKIYFLVDDGPTNYNKFYKTLPPSEIDNVNVLYQLHGVHVIPEDPDAIPDPFNDATDTDNFGYLCDENFKTDAIITLTERQRNDIIERYNLDNVFAIPHSLAAAPKVKNAKVEPFKIVHVERLADFKAQAKAVEVMKLVVEKVPQATLHFCCEKNSVQQEIQELVDENNLGDNIKFEDFSDVAEAFASSALSIFTGDSEEFLPMIQESLQQDCPVVSFDFRYGPREMIEYDANGYLVPVNDAESMADRVIKILTTPTLRKRLSTKCAKSLEKFASKVVAEQWAKLFNQLMNVRVSGVKNFAPEVVANQDAKIFYQFMKSAGKVVAEFSAPELSAPEVVANQWAQFFKPRTDSPAKTVEKPAPKKPAPKKPAPKKPAPKKPAPKKIAPEVVANQWAKLFSQLMNG